MRTKIILVILILFSLVILMVAPSKTNTKSSYPSTIIISEVCSNNRSIIENDLGTYTDYIELYNYGTESIDLKGYGLSDKGDIPHQWVFPSTMIAPDEYLTVFLVGNDSDDSGLYPHFTLNDYGDLIVLSDPEGVTIQQLTVPEMIADMSMGINFTDFGHYVFYTSGTPGHINDGIIIEDVDTYITANQIEYNVEAGTYEEDFELELSILLDQAVIYYTLNGKDPTPSDLLYNDGITISHRPSNRVTYALRDDFTFDSIYPEVRSISGSDVNLGTVIKAQAYIGAVPYGDMLVKTYFVEEAGSQRYSLPIVSISVDPERFFYGLYGIYNVGSIFESIAPSYVDGETPANYNQRGRDWEREIYLEYFNTEGTLEFAQTLGARTFGGWSRMYPKKSIKLYARNSYGDDTMDYPFFQDAYNVNNELIDSFSNLVLRNGGNDWDYTLFRDQLMTGLVSEDIDVQAGQPTILFINGEYWGIYNLREIINDEYIASHYEMEADDVVMLVHSADEPSIYEGDEEDLEYYDAFIEFIESNDLSDDTLYSQAINMIDLDNFLNYYISQIYFANLDWPGNNVKIWRKNIEGIDESAPEGHDGRWRYILYDTDFGFNIYPGLTSVDHDTISFALEKYGQEWPNPPWSTSIFRNFMDNNQFRDAFITRMMDFLNTRFEREHVAEIITYYKDLLQPEIEESINRWPSYNLSNENTWYGRINDLYSFANNRPEFVRLELQELFDLESPYVLTTNASNGEIMINNYIHVTDFQGRYYNEIPVTLEAIASDGYTFIGWQGDIESSEAIIEITLSEDIEVYPIFD